MSRNYRIWSLAAGLLLAAVALAGPGKPFARAQGQIGGWSEPELIFEGDGILRFPTIVADDYGQVHAFWTFNSSSDDEPPLIYYTRLDLPGAQPVDIISGEARGFMADAGADGLMLFWGGGSYSLAGPSPEISAKAWSPPETLGAAYDNGGINVAPDGALWAIYGTRDTNSIFVQRFDPQLYAWENAHLVANTSNVGAAPDALRVAVGAAGAVYAVWTEYQLPNGWPPLGVYYSQSADGGFTWSLPRALAPMNYNQPNVVVGPEGQVFTSWVGAAGVGGKYLQESADGGRVWEPVVAVLPAAPGGGSEGPPVMKFDSAGILHMVFSDNDCVWHVSQEQGAWSAPECVSAGSVGHIEEPTMEISLGNVIHVLYWTQNNQIWHTSRTLPVPAVEPLPLPTQPPPTPTVVIPTSTVAPTPTLLPDFGPPPQSGQSAQAGLWALFAGVVPATLLVLLVLIQRRR